MWENLSLSEKNDLMKLYIKAGIKDLPSMISHYNTYAKGGPKKTYKEWLTSMQERYPDIEFDSNKAQYDYERYFNENYQDALSRLTESEPRHFTDKYKLPSHITFSDESVYSTPRNKGGRWIGDGMFMPSPANVERYPWLYKAYRPMSEEDIYGYRFEEGGPKKKPTLAEYQKQRAEEEQRKYFLEGSRNRNEAYELFRAIPEEDKDYLEWRKNNQLEFMLNAMDQYAENHNISSTLAAIQLSRMSNNDTIEDTAAKNYLDARDAMVSYNEQLKNAKEYLPACIATATSNHPYPGHLATGNFTFMENPGKFGWQRVTEQEARPGSIIQHALVPNNPTHAVILDSFGEDGKRRVNYAPNTYPFYKKDRQDWVDSSNELFYNFVGNSADSLRWEKEYNQLYDNE